MAKNILIDSRMRDFEKRYFEELGYTVIQIPVNKNVYAEISSHVDIFSSKINDKLFLEPTLYNYLKTHKYNLSNVICGESLVQEVYPFDIQYNICQIGNNIIHNFKYTDKKILEYISKNNLNKININQGYSNCSIAAISKNSAIVSDKNIATSLEKNNIKVLLLNEDLNIKLLDKSGKYSKMKGFIGGCMARIRNKIIFFGDLDNLKEAEKIRNFIKDDNLDIVEFKGQDLIDYGGIVEF